MPEFWAYTLGVVLFLLVIMISVALHEWGHMQAGKSLGMDVPVYAVGFGPTLWKRQWRGTVYHIKALPLGGFVQITPGRASTTKSRESTTEGKEAEDALLSTVPPWKRIIVFAAGPIMNLIIGFGILAVLAFNVPMAVGTNTITEVKESSPAYHAGVLPGDTIKSINGTQVDSLDGIKSELLKDSGATEITVTRDGSEKQLTVNVEDHKIGATFSTTQQDRNLGESASFAGEMVHNNLQALTTFPQKAWNTVSILMGHERNEDSLSSVITMGRAYGNVATDQSISDTNKAVMFWYYSGILNLAIFTFNIIPLVPLDGGRIVVALIDMVRGAWARLTKWVYKPVGIKPVFWYSTVGTVIVLGIGFTALAADIVSPVVLK